MKLSIITINYNNAVDLEKTIRSVAAQSWKGFEYLVIDGGSKDESIEIIKKYSGDIDYWVSEKDSGVFNAMNKGITKASGEYLLMLNAGDLLHDETVLEKVFATGEFNQDILYCDVLRESMGKIIDKSIFPDVITFQKFREGSISHQAAFIKRSLHKLIGLYDEQYKFSADRIFFMLAFCKYNVSYKHIPLIFSICNCDGLTCSPENFVAMQQEFDTAASTFFPAFVKDYERFDAEQKSKLGDFVHDVTGRIRGKIMQIIR